MAVTPSVEKPLSLDVSSAPSRAESIPPTSHSTTQATDLTAALKAKELGDRDDHVPLPAAKAQWKLKGMVAVIRHADRTPKQKWKFTFHTKPFVDLLRGHREEVLLVGDAALASVMEAVNIALEEELEDMNKLKLLRISLAKKGGWPGTKVQIKPMFRKRKAETPVPEDNDNHSSTDSPVSPEKRPESSDINLGHQKRQSSLTGVTLSREAAAEDNLELEKLQLIIKWGGEPTHSSRYQSQELGENMRNDLLLMNRNALEDVDVFSSSERRSTTSAQLWSAAFLDQKEVGPDTLSIRKDLLDDSNAAKDEMDKVKKKLKSLLRKGNKAPSQFAWPENMPEPYIVARSVVELMKFHRRVMRENFDLLQGTSSSPAANPNRSAPQSPLDPAYSRPLRPGSVPANDVQNRWCCGEDPDLFKERWEKLFDEFMDAEKVDPSKISELHDTMKFDALHNRPFLEWIFTPTQALLEECYPAHAEARKAADMGDSGAPVQQQSSGSSSERPAKQDMPPPKRSNTEKSSGQDKGHLAQFMGFRKRASVIDPATLKSSASDPATQSYFNLFTGSGRSKALTDVRLEKLRELFLYSKILFDFIGPQEYGITDSEKLEIGLLTSLPLLRRIVMDLEDMQASENAKTTAYFTKESHIYTLLNCIVEGGIQTKIDRNKIPELDYLSTINFELYESQNTAVDDEAHSFNYSIRITISPGCHTFEPLDVYVAFSFSPPDGFGNHLNMNVIIMLIYGNSQLDSRHCIGFAQRRSLTAHNDWKEVIETLRAKFHQVKLPKSFVAVNLSEKIPQTFASNMKSTDQKAENVAEESVSLGSMENNAV